jgi:hypothetical protein
MADVAMTRQVDRAVDLVFAEQAAKGTLPSASSPGGIRFPFSTHNNIAINQTRIGDPRNRKNGMTGASKLGRTGYQMTGVQGPLMVNAYDPLFEGAQRESFTAQATITQAEISQLQSMTTGGLATFSASPISAGVRVGQWHLYASGLDAADRVPILVTGVTATTIQYALPRHGNFTAVGSATDFSLAVKKNAPNAAERWPFAIEDRSDNTDESEVLDFALISQMVWAGQGQGPVNLTFDFLAAALQKLEAGNAPYFTAISETSGEFLTTVETRLNVGGVWVNFESFSFTWNLNAFVDNTNAAEAIDIAYGSTIISGNFTVLDDSDSLDMLDDALADEYSWVAVESIDAEGKFVGAFFPRVKLLQPSRSSKGEDRFSSRTFQMEVSEDTRGGAYVNTMALISSDTAA